MSLTVTPAEVALAQNNQLTDAESVEIVKRSLPYGWERIMQLATRLQTGEVLAIDDSTPSTDKEWSQLLRLFASDPIRGLAERTFGIKLAFQNCCRTAAVRQGNEAKLASFVSMQEQVMNQRPELLDC